MQYTLCLQCSVQLITISKKTTKREVALREGRSYKSARSVWSMQRVRGFKGSEHMSVSALPKHWLQKRSF